MCDEVEEDRDDFTDASLTFSHRFRLASCEKLAGKKHCSIQHLGKTLSVLSVLVGQIL